MMKSIYWHRKFLSKYIIIAFTLFMLASLYLEQKFITVDHPGYSLKVKAAKKTAEVFSFIKEQFTFSGYDCNVTVDPMCSGLIGERISEITTDSGNLKAKRSSLNPNISAYFIDLMLKAHLNSGDTVAVQMTGSYPALDIAMLSAISVMKLKPLIIFSVGSSNYGANRLNFSWPKIYRLLIENNFFDYKILGISIGGARDTGYRISDKTRQHMIKIIRDNKFKYINIPNNKNATEYSISERLSLYYKAAVDNKIKAYINVGGNMASIGLKTNIYKRDLLVKPKSLPTGLITELPGSLTPVSSVAVSMLKSGVKVINIRDIMSRVIGHYDLPSDLKLMPKVGSGKLYEQETYNIYLAVTILMIDIIALLLVVYISHKYFISYKR